MKKFYITTPIYYPSGNPHIGHAYSTLVADVLKRYKTLLGYKTYFVTGTDEHGQKIEQKALEQNLTPIELVNKNSQVFLDLWDKLGVEYDFFIRTTFDFHIKTVQKIFENILNKNLIYLGEWVGLYCIDCEENYTKNTSKKNKDNQLVCQHGHKLVEKKEESYFLKTKQYKFWIIEFLKKNFDLIYPNNRTKELINSFLENNKDDFEDLSISRTNFKWGITTLNNKNHVIYVWFDALLNYITALGYLQDNNQNFNSFWNDKNCEVVHVMSKEITRFHCVYWPIILEMLELRKPTKFICHGWIITPEGKMSKSLKNVIDPFEIIQKYGRDAFRYFLCKEISFKDDSIFNEELLIKVYNNDLSNNFGNLINRLVGMNKKYKNNITPVFDENIIDKYKNFFDFIEKIDFEIEEIINTLLIQNIVKKVQDVIHEINLFIEKNKPWDLFKENKTVELDQFLSLLILATKKVIYYLQPILIDGTKLALDQLNIDINNFDLNFIKNKSNMNNKSFNDAFPIYKRID